MFLWLDDLRDPAEYGCSGWEWVKTAEAAIELLKTGRVLAASLDHDLGGTPGYAVVLWMEEQDIWPERGVWVHSANVSAREKMLLAVDRQYPELVRLRRPLMTPLEQGVQANYLATR